MEPEARLFASWPDEASKSASRTPAASSAKRLTMPNPVPMAPPVTIAALSLSLSQDIGSSRMTLIGNICEPVKHNTGPLRNCFKPGRSSTDFLTLEDNISAGEKYNDLGNQARELGPKSRCGCQEKQEYHAKHRIFTSGKGYVKEKVVA